ncbi:molybdate transport system ATP-binding protein [Acetitomaculum ruminis DSM 5522]|uniref:Molybdate transport system ATP-binding protein n=1 Tax=Acetitomaculum ruminis DSM 5522 TaxID=1120918 RepID=A0A1I0VPV1_9FIRM|nr:ATP-binding cassette domain-containing protein [Acetitomaculum ruminis]SFA77696.1 molybdate transport system ATP-binding protein [Acetitomaculum ruminis DSM 5522]
MSIDIKLNKKLNNFNIDIELSHDGKCLGILGASGCGKSMTLKMIAGIEKPDSGKIVLNGRTIYDFDKKIDLKPQERKVGYLFQNYALFPNMTVEENIGIGLKNKSNSEKKSIVNGYIEKFGLKDLEKRHPYELSGGQQQRCALARIMASSPDIIMLDEPFSALDSFLKDKLQLELLEYLKEFHGDIIMVSHSRDEIYRFCDKLAIMNEGKIISFGDTKSLFINPKKLEAARLTGCKNISKAVKTGDYSIKALDWNVELKTQEKVKDSITHVGIRAHDVCLEYEKSENSLEVFTDRIDDAPFEVTYVLKNSDKKTQGEIWYKIGKNMDFFNDKENFDIKYVSLPKDKLLLLD